MYIQTHGWFLWHLVQRLLLFNKKDNFIPEARKTNAMAVHGI
jgi:hypothetical protein